MADSLAASLSFGFHPAAVLVAVVLAGIATWWVYRQTTPQLSVRRRVLLGTLRFLALTIVILLLAEPIIRSVVRNERKPVVAILLDASRSLSPVVANPAVVHEQVVDLTDRLASDLSADVRTFLFGDRVEPFPPDADSISFDRSRTDISAALALAKEELRGEPLVGMILVSDGLYNTGRNPVYAAEKSLVPIHTVVVGDTTARRDILIQRVATNDIAYVNRELPVRVTVKSDGFEEREVGVSIRAGDQVLTTVPVSLPEGRGEVPVDLSLTPSQEGRHSYEVVLEPLDGELTLANNVANLSIRVLARKLQLLLLAGAPSPDVAAVSEILRLDEDIELTSVTQRDRQSYYGPGVPDDLDRFDAIILAGYPGREADPTVVRRIARSEKPLLFVLDHGTDLRRVQEDLAGSIPALLRTVRPGFVEASAIPTSSGRVHPALDLRSGVVNLVRLPPLAYSQSLWEATPDARTLATVAIRGIELGDPLLVVRDRAGARSAALLGAGLWRWRNVPADLEDVETLSPDLVMNLVRWMTTDVDERPVRVNPTQDFFDGGDRVRLTGQVYDESMNPLGSASVVVTVADPTGNEFRYTLEPLGSGRYAKQLGQLEPGEYSYRAVAELEGVAIGADSGFFAVGELTLEFRDTQADAELMRQIAYRSGGHTAFGSEIDAFVDTIVKGGPPEATVEESVRDLPLRHVLPLMFIVIGLLVVEWVLRKRSGLI
jgi:hypothetical protein